MGTKGNTREKGDTMTTKGETNEQTRRKVEMLPRSKADTFRQLPDWGMNRNAAWLAERADTGIAGTESGRHK